MTRKSLSKTQAITGQPTYVEARWDEAQDCPWIGFLNSNDDAQTVQRVLGEFVNSIGKSC